MEREKKTILVVMVVGVVALLAHSGMVWAGSQQTYSYTVSGTVLRTSGFPPRSCIVVFSYTDPDGIPLNTGPWPVSSDDGSYYVNIPTTHNFPGYGSQMCIKAYDRNIGGITTWEGQVDWTCGAWEETKNVTIHPVFTRNPDVKVATHVRSHNSKAGCDIGTVLNCADIVTTEPGYSVDAFPVFFDLNEYLGCEYGLCWPAWTYSATFTSCSDLVIGGIQWPGDGASHAWLNCQPGPVAVPSFVWLYADGPGMVCPCPHPVSEEINVLSCAEELDEPMCIFCAGVYGMIGDDPCEPTRTEPRSWGSIKAMFE
jgi:hypothetical protein